ncbi:MAG TPA: Ig-like domain-containing protein, partial [Herpetosiphonaceae bacterium]
MRRQRIALAALAALVVLAGAGWLVFRPRQPEVVQVLPTPTLPPKPRPDYTPVPADQISPVIVQRVPERGAELPADGAVELVFDRPMDQPSVNGAFAVSLAGKTEAVAGNLEWVDTRTVRFKPSAALGRANTYDVILKQGARAADGASLNSAYQFRFATAGFLEVGQTIPANDAAEVEAGGVITVMFNRPVVPLLTSGDQSALPQPLSFEPAIEGSGEWLNTSVYVFKPAAPLAGGTTYAARVDPKLADFDGNPLTEGG